MARNTARPLSPHLTIWKWGPHMAISILHRATGTALAIAGGIGLIWWLAAAATGQAAYELFLFWATSWLGELVAIGLTWSFLQHMCSGLRHFVLDTGAGYELRTNRMFAMITFFVSVIGTVAIWAPILVRH